MGDMEGGSWKSGLCLLAFVVMILVLGWALNRGPEKPVAKIHMQMVCTDNYDGSYNCERQP